MGPFGPKNPGGPVGPVDPREPTGPFGPKNPAGPVGPVDPKNITGSTGSTGSTEYTGPVGPVEIIDPSGPFGSKNPGGSVGPVGPKNPTGSTGSVATTDAEVYSGMAEVAVTNGESKKIEFYGTFVPQTECSYSSCYLGWINNYTISGDSTFLGIGGNDTIKPYFEFKTNSDDDFVINRNPNLKEVWVQIIEILCQKINPQITQANPTSDKLRSVA
jgi:hypothetical protein